jgi:phage tail P2-like protein
MNWGNQVLYQSATSLEKALADTEAAILLGTIDEPVGETGLNAELVIDVWDAQRTFLRNLPFLAWAYDVDLWEHGWSEETQRAWTDFQPDFKRIRGTIGAVATALDYAGRDFVGPGGYVLKQYMTPPQGFFVSPSLTVDEFNGWIRLMPEIRIYLGNDPGVAGWNESFVDDSCFIGDDGISYDNGWELYGRKAILRQRGYDDVNLKVIQRQTISEAYEAIDWEEVYVVGKSTCGLFLDEDFVETENYLSCEEKEASLYSIKLDRTFDRVSTELHLSAITPSQEPLTARYERDSDIGYADSMMYISTWDGGGFVGSDFLEVNKAETMLADRIYLLDENISVPMSFGLSFTDVDRLGFPNYTMELMIDLQTYAPDGIAIISEDAIEDSFLESTDLTHFDRACRAVVAAKSLRDRALVAFDPLRPLESSDPVTDATSIDEWVSNVL